MLRRTMLMISLAATCVMAEESLTTPEALVNAFIKDYYLWNGRAAATIGKPSDRQTTQRIEREYGELLAKYCPVGFRGAPLAYGSNSTHDPNASVIVDVKRKDGSATVRTQKPMGSWTKSMHTHEFDLERRNGRWFLVGVYYIDGKERLPSL